MTQLILAISLRDYLPFNPKGFYCITQKHGLAICVKEGLPLARDLSLENSEDSYLCFRLALLHSVSYFFFLYRLPCLCVPLLILFHLTYMRLSRSTHLLCLSLETLMFIIRTGLPILTELIDPANSVIMFLSQTTLLRWLTFLLGSQTVILSPALLDIFISSDASICSTMTFPPLGNSDHLVVSVFIDFPSYSKRYDPFHRIA